MPLRLITHYVAYRSFFRYQSTSATSRSQGGQALTTYRKSIMSSYQKRWWRSPYSTSSLTSEVQSAACQVLKSLSGSQSCDEEVEEVLKQVKTSLVDEISKGYGNPEGDVTIEVTLEDKTSGRLRLEVTTVCQHDQQRLVLKVKRDEVMKWS